MASMSHRTTSKTLQWGDLGIWPHEILNPLVPLGARSLNFIKGGRSLQCASELYSLKRKARIKERFRKYPEHLFLLIPCTAPKILKTLIIEKDLKHPSNPISTKPRQHTFSRYPYYNLSSCFFVLKTHFGPQVVSHQLFTSKFKVFLNLVSVFCLLFLLLKEGKEEKREAKNKKGEEENEGEDSRRAEKIHLVEN